jgi:hypothetical protein
VDQQISLTQCISHPLEKYTLCVLLTLSEKYYTCIFLAFSLKKNSLSFLKKLRYIGGGQVEATMQHKGLSLFDALNIWEWWWVLGKKMEVKLRDKKKI